MDLGLDGRACAVTGASRGIGREVATRLCAEGASVLLVARTAEALEEAAAECAAERAAEPRPLPLDVTAPDAGERIVAAATERFGQLDVLVNNAGTAQRRDLDDVPDEDWHAAWELNVMAPLRAMRRRGPGDGRARLGTDRQRLLDRRQAAVGNDARVLGRQGGGALALAAVRRPLRAASGVLVNAICPGPDQVGAVDGAGRPARPVRGARRRREPRGGARGRRREPARSAASPRSSEIAAAIVFLCSERASYVAGAAWCVDGGTVQVII